jgi:phosphatidylglycerol:prolipoprotein diacylglycerol transferase
MIPYPDIDPEIVRVGPVAIRWYGLAYLLGFATSFLLVKYQIRKNGLKIKEDFIEALYTYAILGLLFGSRLGYVIFYDLRSYLQHPLEIFAVWHGGMSYHGGLIGSVVCGVICCRKFQMDPWQIIDLVIVTAPIGQGILGRIANFINGELYGRATDVPWAMVFPKGGPLPRHPSQLYELFLEGVVLFSLLWVLKDRSFKSGVLTAIYIIAYGSFRFFVELFREPDPQLGFILGPFSMGQVLSFLMILAGMGMLYYRNKVRISY